MGLALYILFILLFQTIQTPPMVRLLLLLVSLILTNTQKYRYSTFTSSSIIYATSLSEPHLLVVILPHNCIMTTITVNGSFPDKNLIRQKEGYMSDPVHESKMQTCKNKCLVVVLSKPSKVEIAYSKELKKLFDYSFDTERGISLKAYVMTSTSVYLFTEIKDWICIPDFTTLFIAFNICGVVLAMIFKIFAGNKL